MIKFSSTNPRSGMKALTLGLSRRNIELLMTDHPLKIMGKEVGCDHDFIFFGETEQTMMAELLNAGVKLPPYVRLHDDRQGGSEH
jgi:hypothetical protein